MKFSAVLLLSIASLAQGFVVPSRSSAPAFVLKATEDTDFDGESSFGLFLISRREPLSFHLCARYIGFCSTNLCHFPMYFFHSAPIEAMVAVGNAVNTKDDVHVYEVGEIEVEEECYMGKDGDFEECVDFDPVP
jgi:hypothetical protein